MAKTKRAKKKLHKAQMTAQLIKYERGHIEIDLIMQNKALTPTEQLQAIKEVITNQNNYEAVTKPNPTFEVAVPSKEAVENVEVQANKEEFTDLRLDVATTLYTHLCEEGQDDEASYEEVLIAKLKQFQEGGFELTENDFVNCDTKQRIYIHITDDIRSMIEDLAKKHKLARRSVVESICTTLIREGA